MSSGIPVKDNWKGKGSWVRKPQIEDSVRYSNFDRIFGKRYSWLELKKFKEMLLLLSGEHNV